MRFTNPTVSLAFALSFIGTTLSAWSAAGLATRARFLPGMANQDASGESSAYSNQKYFAEAFCTPYQKFIEEVAWRGALQYAQALARWQPNGSFQPAMDLYMGNDSRGQLSTALQGMAGEVRHNTYSPTLSSAANRETY